MSELVKNPITIVLAFDAQNCNPNGDPDNDNNPRQFEGQQPRLNRFAGYRRGLRGNP